MTAKDIMTKEVITAAREDSIDKVAALLVEHRISGIPVVDEQRHILGIVTEKDLMIKASQLKIPFYLTLFDSIIFLENPIRFNNNLKKYIASKVGEAMTEEVIIVEEDTPIDEIVDLMQNKRINRVPVVRHNKLVGIITRNDVLKSMVKKNG